MMIEIKTYYNTNFSKEYFFSLMQKVNSFFSPPISDSIDLKAYSEKLYIYAYFVIALKDDEVIGFTAFYKNNETKQLYIPIICVNPNFQSEGIGGRMLQTLEHMSSEGFNCIGLEVRKKNEKAYMFYKKHGFEEKEDRDLKYYMEKSLI